MTEAPTTTTAEGESTTACSHVENCELFVQFALNPALEVWKMHYCQGLFQECIRFRRSTAGKPLPLTLLPNGKLLQANGMAKTDVGAAAMLDSIVKHRTRMVSMPAAHGCQRQREKHGRQDAPDGGR